MGGGISKKKSNIICIGLDNSGKSTILNKLKADKEQTHDIVPTVGLSVENFSASAINFTVFDMSGQGKYRNLWEAYYNDVDGVIVVIDSSDKLRIVVAKEELDNFLHHNEIKNKGIPILIFSNKMDIRDSLSPSQVSLKLELDQIRNKPWQIFGSNALTGENLNEGVNWLAGQIRQYRLKKQ